MKTLHFALITPTSPQAGLRAALRSISSEYVELSWHERWCKGRVNEVREEFVALTRSLQPDLIFLQVQTENVLPPSILERTDGFFLEWCGDCRDNTPEHYFKRAPYVDVMTFSNHRDVENIRGRGGRAEYLNIGVTTEVFSPEGVKLPGEPDIVFLGNNYGDRFPCGRERQQMVAMLRQRYGPRFAVHGNGWGSADGWLNEGAEASAYRACKVAINQNHYDDVPGFTSDRLFRAMSSGAFVISNRYPRIEEDFEIGKHLATWRNFDELTAGIDYYLESEVERKAIANAGCQHVRENHSWMARMKDVRTMIEKYAKVAA